MAAVAVVEAERVLLVCRVGQRPFEFAEDLAGGRRTPRLGGIDDVGEELGGVEQRDPMQVGVGAGQDTGQRCRSGKEPVEARDRHAFAGTAHHRARNHVDPGCRFRSRDTGAVDGFFDTHGASAEQGNRVGDVERFGLVRGVVAERPRVRLEFEAQTNVDTTL